MNDALNELGNSVAWVALALVLMAIGFAALDALTPGSLRSQLTNNINAGILSGAKFISVGIIVLGGITTAEDSLENGLIEATAYSLGGIAASILAFVIIDAWVPVKLRDAVNQVELCPPVIAAAGADIGMALVIAAALS